MLAFSPLNEEVFLTAATRLTYLRLFQHIVRDFVTRSDAQQMLSSENIQIITNAGQAVTVVVPAGTGSTVSPGTGKAVIAYNGSFESPGTQALKQQVVAEKTSAGAATQAAVSIG